MNDASRHEGVVVLCVMVALFGLFLYLGSV